MFFWKRKKRKEVEAEINGLQNEIIRNKKEIKEHEKTLAAKEEEREKWNAKRKELEKCCDNCLHVIKFKYADCVFLYKCNRDVPNNKEKVVECTCFIWGKEHQSISGYIELCDYGLFELRKEIAFHKNEIKEAKLLIEKLKGVQ